MTTTEITTLVAAFTALGATFILPVIKNVFGFQTTKLNDNASLREYLTKELKLRDDKLIALDKKVEAALEETEKWRNLYYEQVEINSKQGTEITTLRADNAELATRVSQLQELVAKNAALVQDKAAAIAEDIKKI